MAYRVKAPWILSNILFSRLVWKMPAGGKPIIYLTFDDGPHPTATPFILEQLERYKAKATFFCIGKNVEEYPGIYLELLKDGHSVGNHTQNHFNGWFTAKDKYIQNVQLAANNINSRLFRPPYGRITRGQINALIKREAPYTIYMWDVLSGDFDTTLSGEQCLQNVLNNIEPGSIVVFHDSEKAWERMSYALPRVLEYCSNKGWSLEALPQDK